MTKKDIIAKLKKEGIAHSSRASKEELEKLLPQGEGAADAPTPSAPTASEVETAREESMKDDQELTEEEGVEDQGGSGDFEVADPLILKPKALPLVVKPKSGKWANSAQEEYASILNAYAYKNPDKWHEKKEVLLKRLTDLGKNPGKMATLRGALGRTSYKNKLIQTEEDHE